MALDVLLLLPKHNVCETSWTESSVKWQKCSSDMNPCSRSTSTDSHVLDLRSSAAARRLKATISDAVNEAFPVATHRSLSEASAPLRPAVGSQRWAFIRLAGHKRRDAMLEVTADGFSLCYRTYSLIFLLELSDKVSFIWMNSWLRGPNHKMNQKQQMCRRNAHVEHASNPQIWNDLDFSFSERWIWWIRVSTSEKTVYSP